MTDRKNIKLDLISLEYTTLKAEQLKRIEHRDHIIYLQIIALGLLFGLSEKTSLSLVTLIVPFICIALGWTYLVNDQKVSSIGKYIRGSLSDNINSLLGDGVSEFDFGWELSHRSDANRIGRKVIQLFIDLLVFVAPAATAIFITLKDPRTIFENVVLGVEGIFVFILAWQILHYADLNKGA